MIDLPDLPIYITDMDGMAMLDLLVPCVWADQSFLNLSGNAQWFIYFHELGHIFNDNPPGQRIVQLEMNCDQISADKLQEMGLSRTYIVGAMEEALKPTPEKILRIKNIENYLSWMPH